MILHVEAAQAKLEKAMPSYYTCTHNWNFLLQNQYKSKKIHIEK